MTLSLSAALPLGYSVVLLEAIGICLMTVLFAIPIGSLRRRYFNAAFFKKHFPELKVVPVGGYPDTGNGKYSDKLSLEEWTTFNNAQRAHLNLLEQTPTALVLLLVAGLAYTRVAAVCGLAYIVGRIVYFLGYNSAQGAPARMRGSAIFYPALIVLLVTSIMTCLELAGGIAGLTAFAKSYVA